MNSPLCAAPLVKILLINYVYSQSYETLKSKKVVKFYVHISPIFSCQVTYYYKISVQSGSFLSDWKQSNVTAVYSKHGPRDDPSNYSPISMAQTKFVAHQLNSYCEEDQFMGPYQGAYCSGRFTEQIYSLFAVVTKIYYCECSGSLSNCVCCLPWP